jgi:hypothetical protein
MVNKKPGEMLSSGWKLEWRRFTPETAQAALNMVQRDRKTNQRWVEALARTMRMGLWETYRPSQIPLMFDREGYRLNGKHRLLAFVASGLPEIVFPVVEGLGPEAYPGTDQDVLARNANAAHPDRQSVRRDFARVSWLEALIAAQPDIKVTHVEFDALAEGKWKREIKWAAEVLKADRGQGQSPYAGAFMYAHRVAPDLADGFARAWVDGGDGLPRALVRLRDAALSGRARNGNRMSGRFGVALKMLYVFALIHQGKPLPDRIQENLGGLIYFSRLARDGAATRWQQRSLGVSEE